MEPRTVLRVEGLVGLGLALGGYLTLEGPIWMLALFALAPDLSMLGYLVGPRLGRLSDNVAHTFTVPVVLGTAGAGWMPASSCSVCLSGPATSAPTGSSGTA